MQKRATSAVVIVRWYLRFCKGIVRQDAETFLGMKRFGKKRLDLAQIPRADRLVEAHFGRQGSPEKLILPVQEFLI